MPLHVVLFQPEIPPNTGNIMRTCAATGTKLHLIEPLGFSLDEKYVRRAAMDYYQFVDYTVYPDAESFFAQNQGSFYMLSRHGRKTYDQFDYADIEEDIYFCFGSESSGIPKPIIQAHLDTALRIPMNEHVRSLNLSNCAMLLVFEALRQQGFPHLSLVEPESQKGYDWIVTPEE